MTGLIARALPLLNKLVPTSLAVKGLSKINPKLASFFTDSIAAGYTADSALDYLRGRLTSSGENMEKQRLENSSSLTPQEKNILQKRNQESGLGKAAAGAIGIGVGLGGLGSEEEQQQAPQQQQPQAQGAQPPPIPNRQQQPPPVPQQPQQQQPQDPLSSIAQQYPELAQFLDDRMNKDGDTFEGSLGFAYANPKMAKYKKVIGQLLHSYTQQQEQQQTSKQPHPNSARGQMLSREQQQQQKQPGQGAQALLAAINELKKIRGG